MVNYIVSDEYEFVYFNIQKVASSSIKTALLPLFGDTDPARYEEVTAKGNTLLRIHKLFARSGYQIDRERLLAGLGGEYAQYFKFAFVRNPWDRLVSCYLQKFARQNASGLKLPTTVEVELYPGMPFAEFAEAVSAIPDDLANPHFRSQHEVVCEPGGGIMADFVGRFESLAADFDTVATKIAGDSHGLRLPHLLPSKGRKARPYAEFYDGRLRELVRERYARDIETFEYSF